MKVIIAGGRDFNDYKLLCKVCDHMLQNQTEIEIVSGKAKGADALGERYAKERGYPIKPFPANWKKFGNMAGPIRNEQMAVYGDALIAFWDGESSGTRNMISCAHEYGLKLKVKRYGK
jgi:hypothetical protein